MRWRFPAAMVAAAAAALTALGMRAWQLTAPLRAEPAPLDTAGLRGVQTSLVLAADGTVLDRLFYGEDRTDLPLSEIPIRWQQAFLAIEDRRFYEHHGVDPIAILRAALANFRSGDVSQGGSTITQQLVKLTLLTPDQTLTRKLQEAALAIRLERHLTKEQILEHYLNRIYFGDGAYGVHAAARVYFGKTPDQLTLGEMTLLAAAPNNPSLYHPRYELEAARARQSRILDAMVADGYITPAEADAARQETYTFAPERPAQWQAPYVTSLAIPEAIAVLTPVFGSEEEARNAIFLGGLRIHTTVDPRVQAALLPAVQESFAEYDLTPEPDSSGVPQPQAAVTVVDVRTGGIAGILGGHSWADSHLNRAFQSLRQPGSAFKPLAVYAPALEHGYTLASVIEDRVRSYAGYAPVNWDNRYHGWITLRQALIHSSNTVAVELMNRIGVETAREYLGKLFTTLTPDDRYLPLALGGITQGVTPLDMAAAYATFARGGAYIKPYIIARIETSAGQVLYEAAPEPVQVYRPQTAYLIAMALGDTMNLGTGGRAVFGRPGGAKTGTTDDNQDIWIVGFSPQYATAVWVGHDQPQPMWGQYGSMIPARTFSRVMRAIHEDLPVANFEKPPGVVRLELCRSSGKLATDACRAAGDVVYEWFATDTAPTELDDTYETVTVCAGTNFLRFDGANCVPEQRTVPRAELGKYTLCPPALCGDPPAGPLPGSGQEGSSKPDDDAAPAGGEGPPGDASSPDAGAQAAPRVRSLINPIRWFTGGF